LHSSFCFYSPGPQQDICVANFHLFKSKTFGDHDWGNYEILKDLGRGCRPGVMLGKERQMKFWFKIISKIKEEDAFSY